MGVNMNIKNIKDEKAFLRKYYTALTDSRGNGFRKYSTKKANGGQRRKKSWLIDMLSRDDNVTVLMESGDV